MTTHVAALLIVIVVLTVRNDAGKNAHSLNDAPNWDCNLACTK